MTTERGNAPAARTGAFQDTRAEKSHASQDTLSGTVGASVIHWTIQAASPLARGRPPDAEPPDVAASGGSPEPASPATSSGLGDASILQQDSAPVYPSVHAGHSTVQAGVLRVTTRPSKRERERAARQAAARVIQDSPTCWRVESASTPGTFHEVHATPSGLVCTCPAHGPCWHIKDRVAPLYAAQLRRQARADQAWIDEFRAPTLLSKERLAVLREQAEYGDSWLSGGAG